MSRIIEIPGGSATLRAPEDVKQKARRRLEMASVKASPIFRKINETRERLEQESGKKVDPATITIAELDLSEAEYDALYEVQTATILAYLESWTLERLLPKDADDLGELPSGLFDALRTATAGDGADAVAPVDFSPNPDPESPTVDGSVSGRPLRAETGSSSTTSFESTGESSDTGSLSAA